MERFSGAGAGGTSIRDIARAAGVSLATVHHYFGSKDGLYQACVDAMYVELDALRTQLEPLLLSGGDLKSMLDRIVRATYRFARSHRAAIRLILRDVLDTGQVRADRRARHVLPFLSQGAAVLSMMLNRPAAQLRLELQTLNHVVVRYALTVDAELMLVAGVATETEAVQAVEDHLVSMAQRMLQENG